MLSVSIICSSKSFSSKDPNPFQIESNGKSAIDSIVVVVVVIIVDAFVVIVGAVVVVSSTVVLEDVVKDLVEVDVISPDP